MLLNRLLIFFSSNTACFYTCIFQTIIQHGMDEHCNNRDWLKSQYRPYRVPSLLVANWQTHRGDRLQTLMQKTNTYQALMLPLCLLRRALSQVQAPRYTPLLYVYSNLRFLDLNLHIFTSTSTFSWVSWLRASHLDSQKPERETFLFIFFKLSPEVITEGAKKHPYTKVQ